MFGVTMLDDLGASGDESVDRIMDLHAQAVRVVLYVQALGD